MSRNNFECEMRLAVATAVQDPQPDPNASLGGFKSSTTVDALDGSITGAGDLYHFTDSARAGPTDYTGSWIIFMGEFAFVAATDEVNFAVEVIGFDTDTGEFTLDGPLPIVLTVGHLYRLYTPNNLFSAWDALTSVSREDRYRLMFAAAGPNGQVDPTLNVWVTDHRPGPLLLEAACSTHQALDGAAIQITSILDEFQLPDLTTVAGGLIPASPAAQNIPQDWQRSPDNQNQLMTPRMGGSKVLSGNQHRAIWLRLSFRDEATLPRPQTCAFQVHVQGDIGDEELGASFMVLVDIDGPDLEIIMGPDRKDRRLGGSRVKAIVRDSVTKLPIANYTPVITLDTAEGTLHPQNQEETTEDGVIVQRVYTASALAADVGKDIDFSLEVF
jgi:hypothetical protein